VQTPAVRSATAGTAGCGVCLAQDRPHFCRSGCCSSAAHAQKNLCCVLPCGCRDAVWCCLCGTLRHPHNINLTVVLPCSFWQQQGSVCSDTQHLLGKGLFPVACSTSEFRSSPGDCSCCKCLGMQAWPQCIWVCSGVIMVLLLPRLVVRTQQHSTAQITGTVSLL
jgi:hypothetical protein